MVMIATILLVLVLAYGIRNDHPPDDTASEFGWLEWIASAAA